MQLGFTGSTVATYGTVVNNFFTNQATLAVQNSDGNTIQGNTVIGYGQASNVTTFRALRSLGFLARPLRRIWLQACTCASGRDRVPTDFDGPTPATSLISRIELPARMTNQPAYLGAADENRQSGYFPRTIQ